MRALLLVVIIPFAADLGVELKRVLVGDDPPRQVEVLDGLPRRLADATEAERRAVARALVRVLGDDTRERLHPACLNPLVATEVPAGIRAVLPIAYGREPSVMRAVAREALATQGGMKVTEALGGFLRQDASPRARAHLSLMLGRRGDRSAGPVLVAALSDTDPMVVSAAAESLTRLHGTCLGYKPGPWKQAVEKGLRGPRASAPAATPHAPGAPGETVTAVPVPRDPIDEIDRLVPGFFGIALDRSVVVVVLDFSGSVRRRGGKAITDNLGRSLALLPSTRKCTVLAFDERILPLASEPVITDPDFKEKLAEFLDGLPPGQRTELLLPVRTGLELARRSGAKDSQVLIVSDGAPTVDGPPLRDLLEKAEGLADAGVRVDAAVHGGREVGLFRYLVKLTGGKYVRLP